jgi:hypothetical protein
MKVLQLLIDCKIINYMVTDEEVQETHRLLTDADEELEEKGACQ